MSSDSACLSFLDNLQLCLEGSRGFDGLEDGDEIPGGHADGVQGLDYLADADALRQNHEMAFPFPHRDGRVRHHGGLPWEKGRG